MFDLDPRREPEGVVEQQETLPGFYASDGKFVLLPASPPPTAQPEKAKRSR